MQIFASGTLLASVTVPLMPPNDSKVALIAAVVAPEFTTTGLAVEDDVALL